MGAVTIGLEGGVNFRYDRLNTDLDSLPGLNLNYSDKLEFCQVSPRVTPTFRLSVYGVDVRIRLPFSYEIISPSGMKARTYPDFSPSLNLRGRLEDLPFLPQEYKYDVIKDVKGQYDVVHGMLMREDIDRVYWAGDAGKEGQTIEENIRNFGATTVSLDGN